MGVSPCLTQKQPNKSHVRKTTRIKFDKNEKTERTTCKYCDADYDYVAVNCTKAMINSLVNVESIRAIRRIRIRTLEVGFMNL